VGKCRIGTLEGCRFAGRPNLTITIPPIPRLQRTHQATEQGPKAGWADSLAHDVDVHLMTEFVRRRKRTFKAPGPRAPRCRHLLRARPGVSPLSAARTPPRAAAAPRLIGHAKHRRPLEIRATLVPQRRIGIGRLAHATGTREIAGTIGASRWHKANALDATVIMTTTHDGLPFHCRGNPCNTEGGTGHLRGKARRLGALELLDIWALVARPY